MVSKFTKINCCIFCLHSKKYPFTFAALCYHTISRIVAVVHLSVSETPCGSDDDDFDSAEMSFSDGDDNNHDFCDNDGQLCDVRR